MSVSHSDCDPVHQIILSGVVRAAISLTQVCSSRCDVAVVSMAGGKRKVWGGARVAGGNFQEFLRDCLHEVGWLGSTVDT